MNDGSHRNLKTHVKSCQTHCLTCGFPSDMGRTSCFCFVFFSSLLLSEPMEFWNPTVRGSLFGNDITKDSATFSSTTSYYHVCLICFFRILKTDYQKKKRILKTTKSNIRLNLSVGLICVTCKKNLSDQITMHTIIQDQIITHQIKPK